MERERQEMTATILFPLYACVSDEMEREREREKEMTMMRRDAVAAAISFLPVFSVRCSYFRTRRTAGKATTGWARNAPAVFTSNFALTFRTEKKDTDLNFMVSTYKVAWSHVLIATG